MQLRRALGVRAIETHPHGYRLVVPADDIDAHRFERLVARAHELLALGDPDRAAYVADEALGLWRGPALVDLDGWQPGRAEAERLDELRRDAQEVRLEAALRSGRFREVLAEARVMVADAPLREHRWSLLALAQYQAGRQAEALRTIRQARGALREELGLDPGPELVALERAILNQDPSLVATALPDPSGQCPYLGLVAYDVPDADGFFGRDAGVSECLHRLAETGALAVVGPSGSGKSSLVRAGVAAALERDGHRVVVITPGANPMDALTAASISAGPPILVVDQCEEAVTLCADAGERAQFFAALADHAERAGLVVALRADRLGELTAHPAFTRLVERGLFLLRPMDEDDMRAAIEGLARQAGLLLEPRLVDLLIRDVEGEPGAQPLLSHALQQTWQRREGRTLTVAGYQASGGIRGAVAQSAEAVYEQALPSSDRSSATCCFGWWPPLPRAIRCVPAYLDGWSRPIPNTSRSSSSSSGPGWSPATRMSSRSPTSRSPVPGPGCAAGSTTTSKASASGDICPWPPTAGTPWDARAASSTAASASPEPPSGATAPTPTSTRPSGPSWA